QADDALLRQEAQGQLHEAVAGQWVEEDGQDGDHEDRAAVAELVFEFAGPDETDDRPAHAQPATLKGRFALLSIASPASLPSLQHRFAPGIISHRRKSRHEARAGS